MNRRSFLGMILASPLARLLPKRPFFTPRSYEVSVPISLEDLNRVTLAEVVPGISDAYFQASPLLAYFQKNRPPIPEPPPLTEEQRWEAMFQRQDDEVDYWVDED